MARSKNLEALADVAEAQWGLFTRRQAEATGMAWTTSPVPRCSTCT
jgi:hypothetical protein